MRRESPTARTLLSVLAEAVWRHGVDQLALGTALGKASCASSIASPSIYSASNLSLKGTWGSKVAREGVRPRCRAGTVFQFCPSLRTPPLRLTVTGHGVHHFLGGVYPWRLPLWHAWELLHQSISCSDSLMVLNLSTSSLSSATMLSRSSTCSHLTQVEFPLPSPGSSRLRHSVQPET